MCDRDGQGGRLQNDLWEFESPHTLQGKSWLAAVRLGWLGQWRVKAWLGKGSTANMISPMKSTTLLGNTTMGHVLATLLCMEKKVLLPVVEGGDYDLAYDEDGTFVRVQRKTGRVRGSIMTFTTHSIQRNGSRKNYRGLADVFGVYCAELHQVYLVPVDDVPVSSASLRLSPARNGMSKGIRMAVDYAVVV